MRASASFEVTIFSSGPDSVLGFDTLVEVYHRCIRRIPEEAIKETYGATREVYQGYRLQTRVLGGGPLLSSRPRAACRREMDRLCKHR